MACDICAYAAEHGSWPDPKITHCRDCHRTWPRRATTPHCTKCHRHFGGQRGFDRHQRISPEGVVCLDPATLSPPLTLDEGGVWRQAAPAALQNRTGATHRYPPPIEADSSDQADGEAVA